MYIYIHNIYIYIYAIHCNALYISTCMARTRLDEPYVIFRHTIIMMIMIAILVFIIRLSVLILIIILIMIIKRIQ